MRISAISKIYWRMIKDGQRTFDSVAGIDKKREIKELAAQEVANNEITEEDFRVYIGESYQPDEQSGR